MSNDPRLVSSQALAKAQDLENRLNAIIPGMGPEAPSIMYAGGTTIVTQSANGTYTWTCPAGVTSAKIECWGAGAGGDGATASTGAGGGGGGEYAAEANYATVPGTVYTYVVGNGGSGGTTGNPGATGGDSSFDQGGASGGGVYAFGGLGSDNTGPGGAGGSGSANSIEHPGGAGGTAVATGGGGGGSSASPSGAGNAGTTNVGGGTASGGSGGTDQGAGGTGAAVSGSGTAGGAPGGGGGGAGTATAAGQFSKDYQPTFSGSYFGSDATGGNANQRRNYSGNGDGTLWQGGETASGGSYNGTMKSIFILPSSITSDLAGGTVDKILLRLLNTHSWYNSGQYIVLGYTPFTSLGASWTGSSITAVKNYWVSENVQSVADLTSTGLGAALVSGAAKSLSLGPGTPGFNLYNYGSFFGASSNTGKAPDLHIEWHTGAAPVQGGTGHDGQVRITYASAGPLVAAVQPAAGTDDSGNSFAAGFTGSVSQIQPGSSPANVEGWHTASMSNSWTPFATGSDLMYTLTSDGFVHLSGRLTTPAGVAVSSVITTLPAGYQPARSEPFAALYNSNTTPFPSTAVTITISTGGVITVFNASAGTTLNIQGRFPLSA